MAATERLREFVAHLTYQVDSSSERRFDDSLRRTNALAMKLGATLIGAASAAAYATIKISDGFEKLYYSSQRTGASVKNIKGITYAVSQLGGTASSANDSLEGFGNFIRSNPGSLRFIEQLGVRTRDANGAMRDTGEMFLDIGERLRKMPFYQSKYYGSFMGINEETLIALNRGVGKFKEQSDAIFSKAGVDPNAIASRSKDFMQQVRELFLVLGVLKDKVFSDLQEKYGPKLKELVEYIINHLPDIASRIEHVIQELIVFASKIDDIATKLGGWKTVGEAVLVFFATTWVAGMLSAIGAVSGALLPILAAGAAGYGIGWLLDQAKDKAMVGTANAALGGASDFSGKARGAFNFFRRSGWSVNQSAGIVANLLAENSNLDPSAVGDGGSARGIGQWHPDRQAEFAKFAGIDIGQSTLAQQLAFKNYELTKGLEQRAGRLLRGTDTAGDAARVESQFDFRPADVLGERLRRSERAYDLLESGVLGVTTDGDRLKHVDVNTTIHVGDTGDPAANAREVASQQSRVVQDVARNMGGKIR